MRSRDGGGGDEGFEGNQRVGQGAGVFAGERFGYLEKHDVGGNILSAHVVGSGGIVDEGEGFACVVGEVDDDVEAFGRGHEEIVEFERGGKQTAVGSDLIEGRDVEGLVENVAGRVGR